jgi:hypothetical protein
MGSENDEIDIMSSSALRDLVAHWSFLDQPMHRGVIDE